MSLRLASVQYLLLLLSIVAPLSLASANQDIFAAATTEQNVQVELFQFDSPHKQKVAIELAKSLRCPQCQNQNLVESNSPIAKDLRLIVFSKINQGQSEQQVIDFMTARYGEFVLYKPAFSASNALLWLAPILLLLLFLIVSFVRIEQRKQR
ncbi:heme lyase NrfEFG subunit NrfF [Vibrio tubiashii]|uniref:Formate-dependent nitrite reductase complex subunit n=1 Tax=Vibrio tubiashii TaxID=29498 RepID=A0AAE5LID6_9VIBR|nr:heme lyase NrfEFG subunit NrfF [Vibrio tubiashii]NOI81434.1 heme lyase NrfEFG subunit NrfF [Vibrio tubiashii]